MKDNDLLIRTRASSLDVPVIQPATPAHRHIVKVRQGSPPSLFRELHKNGEIVLEGIFPIIDFVPSPERIIFDSIALVHTSERYEPVIVVFGEGTSAYTLPVKDVMQSPTLMRALNDTDRARVIQLAALRPSAPDYSNWRFEVVE